MSEVMQLPEGWTITNFGAIAKINMGQSPNSNYVNEEREGIPFLQGNAEFGEIHPEESYWVTEPKKLAKKDDILMSVRAPVGEINLADRPYCIGRGLAALTIQNLDQRFGFYSLSREKRQLNRLAQGSTFLAVSKNDIDRIIIIHPKEITEQHRIAEILSTLDRTIEASEKLIAKEKQIKKGLMNDLLTHGIDDHGRIRTPQTHRYKESELGMIPERWTATSLGTIINNKTKKSDFSNRIPVIDMEHIEQDSGKIIPNSWTEEYPKDKIKFTSGNTLFGKLRPYLKKYWYCDFEGACTSELLVLEAKKNIDQKFAYYLLHIEEFMAHANRFAYGTKMPRVSFSDLKSFTLAIPITSLEQERIADILTAQDKKIETEEANLAKLKELKKGLMNDLLSGSVRVKV